MNIITKKIITEVVKILVPILLERGWDWHKQRPATSKRTRSKHVEAEDYKKAKQESTK